MSLLPLSTAWVAVSRLAPEPVAFYAPVFFLVNDRALALSRQFPQRDLVVESFLGLGCRLRPREHTLQKLHHSTAIEVDDHLMMLHALAALYKTQVPHETIVTVAHASEATIPEHLAENALADDSVKS
jgi:hypothetical protein